ncbi:hypothetical protein [Streptomyces sp. NPDC059063]|uniref:nSTAND1 domain-containing NTPase n=1 Tax=unclassified Streptomyces TaxID=2593676 RepID=UPI0036AC2B74
MDRRRLKLFVDVLLVLVAALMGLAANYATSRTDHVPWVLRTLRDWSLPLLALAVLLLVAGQVWLHLLERPAPVRPGWESSRPPYPGLEAFAEGDAGVFFGRDREVRELVGRLRPLGASAARRFVAVIGPSGSGKSSLVCAGLLPALGARRERWVTVGPFAPGRESMAELRSAFAEARRLRTERGGRGVPVLLVIDQLEELITLAAERDREAVLAGITEALAGDPHLWVVATLRSDFLTDLLETGHADLVQQPLLIGVLGRSELFEVIEKPAARAGLTFAPDLVARMVDDTGGGDALPLLAYTLQSLSLRALAGDGAVGLDDYRQLGGVAGALSEQADRIMAELAAGDSGAPVLDVLLKFVTLEHGEPTRRRVRRADLTAGECAVTDAFVAGRLLTGDGDVIDVAHEALFRQWGPLRGAVAARAEVLRRRTELERAARDWESSGWRDAYLLSGQRLAAAREWVDDAPEVFAGVPLVADFLDISSLHDAAALGRIADAVARRAMQSAESDPELALLAALAAADECGPTLQVQRALHTALNFARRCAVFRADGGAIARAVGRSPDGARIAGGYEDGRVRVWAVDGGGEPVVLTRRGGEDDTVFALAWSPDGKSLAVGYRDCQVVVWDAESWAEWGVVPGRCGGGLAWSPDGGRLAVATHHDGLQVWDANAFGELAVLAMDSGDGSPVRGTAWSPDGHRLAGACDDGRVRLWNPASGAATIVRTYGSTAALDGAVVDVAWSPDGRWLASASADRATRVWDMGDEDGGPVTELTVPAPLTCVAWSPDSTWLAAGDNERTTHLSNRFTYEPIKLAGHTDGINSLSWHGSRLATASRDGTLALWDIHHPGAQTIRLYGHETARYVSWSPDGTCLAGTLEGESVLIWDVAGDTERAKIYPVGYAVDAAWSPDGAGMAIVTSGGAGGIWLADVRTQGGELLAQAADFTSITWSPDGRRLATTHDNAPARIWNATDGTLLRTLDGDRQSHGRAVWSPDGRRVATALNRTQSCVWDADTGARLTLLDGHTDYAWSLAWSPDGRRIATGSRDHTARVWDADTGTELARLTGHEERVRGLGWSPDGRHLATASWDHTVRLWDPDDGRALAVIGVHEDQVDDLAWSPDGTHLATVSRDRTLRVWNATPDLGPLLDLARSRVFRDLTDDERRGLLLPPRRTP